MDIYDADKGKLEITYTESEALVLAQELVEQLEYAFVSAQKHGGVLGGGTWWGNGITYSVKKKKNGGFSIVVTYPPQYLFRPSLWRNNRRSGRAGSGINDIFALFTTGYRSSRALMPAGYWESTTRMADMGFVRAPSDWEGNPFIRETITRFESEHPGISIEYPEEWH